MCERHYRRALKHGTTDSPRIDNLNHYEVHGECWRWLGAFWGNGYGKTSVKLHGTRLAHRVFYIEANGPVDVGLDLDHRCRHRWCVRPDHLEPVTRALNLQRGLDARTTCRSGRHDITKQGALKPGTRQCVECWRANYRAAGAKYRERKRLGTAIEHSIEDPFTGEITVRVLLD